MTEPGTLIHFTLGDYEGDHTLGYARVLRPFSPDAVLSEFMAEVGDKRRKRLKGIFGTFDTYQGGTDALFIKFVVDRGYVEMVEGVHGWYLGAPSFSPSLAADFRD